MTTDDPCDDWSDAIATALAREIFPPHLHDAINRADWATGGTISAPRPAPIIDLSGPEAIMPKRRHVPQAVQCRRGQHAWTRWGPFMPAPINYEAISAIPTGPAQPLTMEAYRWRYCQCGAAERESHADQTIKFYSPDEP